MSSRRLTAFPKSGTTPNLTFNSGSKNRKVRAAKWGAMSSCAAKILTRACRFGGQKARTHIEHMLSALPLATEERTFLIGSFAPQAEIARGRYRSSLVTKRASLVRSPPGNPAPGRRPCHPKRDGWAKLGHATSKCDGNQSLRRQPLHLGNDRFELCIVLHRFHRRDPRCIWATRFGKVITRSFLVLHESIVSRQSILSWAGCAACRTLEPNGGRASGETAAVCAGAVVRNGHPRRLVRC
jgi:hypothetical protein